MGIDMEKLKKAKGKEMERMMQEAQAPAGPTMMFVTLDYPGCCDKKTSEELGTKWATMLRASGMDISTYVIEENQILYQSQTGKHAYEIRDYALTQPECVAVEWSSKRISGPAETPAWIEKDEARKAAKKEKDDQIKAEKEAAEKAAKKKKKKKKKASKANKEEV